MLVVQWLSDVDREGLAMPLSSPRFKDNATLVAVEANRMALARNSNGVGTHLVQMALVDLGFAMPRSTGSDHYSPDGIYGQETVDVVKAFQRAQIPPLKDDGVVGPNTLRALDAKFPGFTHKVKLHFRSIALTNVPFNVSLRNAELVFAQYGIQIEFASGESLLLSDEQTAKFDKIDQACKWNLNDGEFAEVQGLGSRAPNTDILVFHVSRFANANSLGCGGHMAGRPACTITASALGWDTAHEVCHVLLGSAFRPVHSADKRNLMFATSRSEKTMPQMTVKQVAKIKASGQCSTV
jgi:Putative peptidoglycan binding domain